MKRFNRLRSTLACGLAVLLLSTAVMTAGVGWTLRWEDVFDSGPYDAATWGAMEVVGNRLFVGGRGAGATGGPEDFGDIIVRAYDAGNGGLLWDDRFDLAGGNDNLLGLSIGADRVFVTGWATDAAGIMLPVLRVHSSPTGELLWQAVPNHQGLLDSAVTDGSSVFAIGVIGEDDPPVPGTSYFFRSDWLVRAYDLHSGRLLWQDRFGAPDPTGAVQLDRPVTVAAAGGRVFVSGRAHASPQETPRWYVRAYDAKTGALLWQDQVPGRFSQPAALTVVGHRVVAAGHWAATSGPTNQNWLVRSYDATTGALAWEDVVDTGISQQEQARAVAATGGRVFVAGIAGTACTFFPVAPANCDALLRTYDAESGVLLWEDRLDSGATLDEYWSVAAQGHWVYAVGDGGNDCALSFVPTNCDGLIRVYDARSGHLVWEDRLNKSGTDDEVWAMAVQGPRVFVSGTTYDGSADFLSNLVVRAYVMRGGDDRNGNDDHDDFNDRD